MFAWNVQPNGYLPGLVGAVNVAVPPSAVTLTSKAPCIVEVTVWFWLSWFFTVTFVPGATEAGTEYMKLLIVIACAALGELDPAADRDGIDGDGEDDDAELRDAVPAAWEPETVAEAPQPLSPTSSAAAVMVNSPGLMLTMGLSEVAEIFWVSRRLRFVVCVTSLSSVIRCPRRGGLAPGTCVRRVGAALVGWHDVRRSSKP
jgi:hypothetical protein